MIYTEEHIAIAQTTAKLIESEINPYCDQWEEEGIFPAKELFKKMGSLGLLGIHKPAEYGGMGLDYSYHWRVYGRVRPDRQRRRLDGHWCANRYGDACDC